MNIKRILLVLFGIFVVFLGIFLAAFFLPWRVIDWGSVRISSDDGIVVSGYAELEKKNEKAQFSAGITVVSDDKEQAIAEVNNNTEKLINDLKVFGIPEEDIKTQSINVYQNQEQYYDNSGVSKMRPGQWTVSNNVDVVLRDIAKSEDLSALLAASGATNVYGPNFMLADGKDMENELLQKAIEDATNKANIIAQSTNKKVVKVVKVIEGTDYTDPYSGMYRMEGGGGGGMPLQPGTSTVSKSVTVIFETK